MNDPYFQRLLDLYLDGGLSGEELAEFERILLSTQKARAMFWEQAHLHQALRQECAEVWGERAAEAEILKLRASRNRWIASIAALVIATGTAWFFLSSNRVKEAVDAPVAEVGPSDALPPKPAPQPGMVAVIGEMVEARLDSAFAEGLHKGEAIDIGEISLRSGFIGMTFFNGAHVVLEGPARINVLSESSMRVDFGNVRIECPEVARGFTVTTPNGRIVDSGAVFSISVDDDGAAEVRVESGLVLMRGSSEDSETEVSKDNTAFFDLEGSSRIIENTLGQQLEAFVRRVDDDEQRRFEIWRESSEKRVGDKDLLVYLRLLDDKGSTARLVRNEGGSGAASGEAAVIAPNWVEGRWPGKRALLFDYGDERARIEIRGSYSQVTFAAWVKVLGFQRPFNALLMSDCDMDGEVHWQFSQEGGIRFGVRPSSQITREKAGGAYFHRAWVDRVLVPSKNEIWRHLVTTYDAENKTVTHYVDGEEISRHSLFEGVPIQFGKATIGNTSYGTRQFWGSRQFGGAIDELAIFSRILNSSEIEDLYVEGKPEGATKTE